MRHDHLSVPFETAAGKNDALPCTDTCAIAIVFNNCAHHSARFVDDEILCRGGQPNVDTAVEQSFKKSGDKCSTLWSNVLGFATSKFRFYLWSSGHEIFGERGRSTKRHKCAALDDFVFPLRQAFADGIGVGFHGATRTGKMAFPSPWCVVVGERLNVERGRGVLHEVLEHLRCGVDENLEEFGIRGSAIDNTFDVGECCFLRIGNAGLGHDVVVGQPDAAA